MSHLFQEYGPDRGDIAARRKNGSLVSMEDGERWLTRDMVQERGRLMSSPVTRFTRYDLGRERPGKTTSR